MKSYGSTLTTPIVSVFTLLLFVAGCSQSAPGSAGAHPAATPPVPAHPTEGPHHGGLIELGDEEYHAELVHDEAAGRVTVYLLDSTAKTAVPIDARELLVNLSHDGKAEQFKLIALPDTDDPTGKSSRFVSEEVELADELDHEYGQAHLVVAIDGKQFRGRIPHEQEHDEHDH